MKLEELRSIIDKEAIEVPRGDAYLAMAKVGKEVSVSLEGDRDVMAASLLNLMRSYREIAIIVRMAFEDYIEEAE